MPPDPYSWRVDLDTVILVPAAALAYTLWVRRHGAERWRITCFFAALALLLLAFNTPLDTIAIDYLLSAHLLQNVIVAEWAPALAVLGIPPALGERLARLPGARFATHPVVALPVWLATYFLWHLPVAYDAALRHPATLLHLEHACYFAAGLLLWWPVFQDAPHRLPSPTRSGYLFLAFLLGSPLELLLTLLPNPVYETYENGPGLWGLSPLKDQQLAGVTMAAEQSVVFFAAFAWYFARFMREQEVPP